jgi:hypothetical protein
MHAPTLLNSETPPATRRPGRAVRVIGLLTALWCAGFAVVNVVFELTHRFSDGPYAEYAAGITVMNWLVVGLKALGATVALLSIADRSRWPSPTALTVLVWGAFATIAVYATGSVAQWIGMASGLTGRTGQLDAAAVAYVLFFIAAAVGFGILAISYYRRHQVRKTFAFIGVVGAPVMLLLVLVIVPTVLVGLGVMPTAD